jgi:hypothetical protein
MALGPLFIGSDIDRPSSRVAALRRAGQHIAPATARRFKIGCNAHKLPDRGPSSGEVRAPVAPLAAPVHTVPELLAEAP